jgi:hypothetical protein
VAGSSSDNLNDVVLKYKYVVSIIAAWEFHRLVQ